VVSKAASRRLLDDEAYDLAKEVRWGDLWPSHYMTK